MFWNMGGSILYLSPLAYAALYGCAAAGKHFIARGNIFSVKTVGSARLSYSRRTSQCYFCPRAEARNIHCCGPIAGERQNVKTVSILAAAAGSNTARQSPGSDTRYARATV
jgi:hypothetical protein